MFFSFDKSIGFSFLFKFKQQMQNAPGFDGKVQSDMNTEKNKKANLPSFERKNFCFDHPLYSR